MRGHVTRLSLQAAERLRRQRRHEKFVQSGNVKLWSPAEIHSVYTPEHLEDLQAQASQEKSFVVIGEVL